MLPWPYPPVMAHRCGGALAPENTLAGLPIAARLGCKGVEFDVMLSGSGTPVLIHDETLERTTTGQGKVSEASDTHLASLDAGVKFHKSWAGTRLPTFSEAIRACLDFGLAANVEIKPATGHERATGAVVARMAVEGWAKAPVPPLLSSFSEEALLAAAEAAQQIPRGWLIDRVPADWQQRSAQLDVIAIHTNCLYLEETTARAIKAAGYRLVVYTENGPEHAKLLFSWGVDAVITDRPDIVRGRRGGFIRPAQQLLQSARIR